MTPDLDTIAVVDAAIARDPEAFGELYRRYVDTVFRYVYYRVPTKTLAEDITADTFVSMLRRIGTYEHRGIDFGAWLVTIARNLIADHFKRLSTQRETYVDEMLDTDELELAVDVIVLAGMGAAAVREAVERLNDKQRECVTLRFLQGLSVAEAAAAMDMNDGALKTLQYRAVRTLARNAKLKEALSMNETTVHTVALPPGYRAVAEKPLFRCGANARLHPMARHRVTKGIRGSMITAARAAGIGQITVPVSIRAVQHPATGSRALDAENIAPLVKAAIDGLRDAGVLINDSCRYVTEVHCEVGDRVPGGQLVLHLTEIRAVVEPKGTHA